jgi:Xaa-Pro aminopeptidase
MLLGKLALLAKARRLLVIGLAFTAFLSAKVPLDEFHARRAALKKSLDGVLLLKGRVEPYDRTTRFEQDSNFYYLTGWSEPGAALLLTPAEEILFLPAHNEHAEKFGGKRMAGEDADAPAVTGFDNVEPIAKLESEMDRLLSSHEKLYAPCIRSAISPTRRRSSRNCA